MPTFQLKRFSDPDALKTIQPGHLLYFLSPHREYFKARGVPLPPPIDAGPIDYEGLAQVLMTPDGDMPKALTEDLYLVNEMATPEGMDELLAEAERIGIDLGPDPTPADVAVQMWLRAREAFERKHCERFLQSPRSFEYFYARSTNRGMRRPRRRKSLRSLERDLDNWFEKKKRGRDTRVFIYEKGTEAWFLVRHGDPCKREGSIEKGKSSSVFYRPEKHDVLVYSWALGELRIHAGSQGERELYRKMIGKHLFGDRDYFPAGGKYSLEPLKADGVRSLACGDVPGMEWAKLKEVWCRWGGPFGEVEIHRAEDLFAALEARSRELADFPEIVRASFLVKFIDSRNPRTVKILVSNVAQYTRDADGDVVEDWLRRRGFILPNRRGDHGHNALIVGSIGANTRTRGRRGRVEKATGL